MLDGTHYVECECTSAEHTLRFTIDVDDEVIYTEVHLNPWQPWYKRVWMAVKYVFGYRCKYGNWDCTMLNVKQVEQLELVINTFKKMKFDQKLQEMVERSNNVR